MLICLMILLWTKIIGVSEFMNFIWMAMMFKMPSKKEESTDEDAPFVVIRKMNQMLKTLSNTLPYRVGLGN